VLRRTAEVTRDLEGLADGSRGTIVLGASFTIGSYALPQLLSRFRRDRPSVNIRLDVADYRNVTADVESAADDFGVVAAPSNPATRRLISERIGSDPMVAITAPGSGLAGSTLSREDFVELPFVQIAAHAAMDRELDRAGIRPREIVLDLGHPEAVKRAVQQGLGVSVLFRSAVTNELEAGTLQELEIEGVSLALDVYIVHREGKRFAPAHEELLAVIRKGFATTHAG
jgi:DNA-binding transcriptional LysR family regulator